MRIGKGFAEKLCIAVFPLLIVSRDQVQRIIANAAQRLFQVDGHHFVSAVLKGFGTHLPQVKFHVQNDQRRLLLGTGIAVQHTERKNLSFTGSGYRNNQCVGCALIQVFHMVFAGNRQPAVTGDPLHSAVRILFRNFRNCPILFLDFLECCKPGCAFLPFVHVPICVPVTIHVYQRHDQDNNCADKIQCPVSRMDQQTGRGKAFRSVAPQDPRKDIREKIQKEKQDESEDHRNEKAVSRP